MSEPPSNQETLARETVAEHRRGTILSGRLSEFQESNLKKFVCVAFDDLEQATLEYDLRPSAGEHDINSATPLERSEVEHYVRYNLNFKGGKKIIKTKEVLAKAQHLERWVRDLFWNNVRVEVLCGSKVIYKSKS